VYESPSMSTSLTQCIGDLIPELSSNSGVSRFRNSFSLGIWEGGGMS